MSHVLFAAVAAASRSIRPASEPAPEATVSVSPSSFSVDEGDTQQLTATVENGSGDTTWQSSDTDVAAVSSSGLVTGVAAGSVTITATNNGASDTSSGTVTEPAGGGAEPFFTESFAGGQFNNANGFAWTSNPERPSLSSAIARTGTHSLRTRFGPGINSWEGAMYFALGRQLTETWIEYYIYFPDGTEGIGSAAYAHPNESPSNNKFIRLFSNYSGTNAKVGASLHFRAGGASSFDFELTTSDIGIGQMTTDGPSYTLVPADGSRLGQWIQIRQHFRMVSAPGAADCVLQLWVDGALVIDHLADQAWETSLRYWDDGYLMGATGADFATETHVYLDDFAFYDSDPGW